MARGVVWFIVVSSAPGKQGCVTTAEENGYLRRIKASPTAALFDPAGQHGHLFSAKTTPQVFLIDPKGNLIYDGVIDDRPTTGLADIAGVANYLSRAVEEATAGQEARSAVTHPYGRSVRYPD